MQNLKSLKYSLTDGNVDSCHLRFLSACMSLGLYFSLSLLSYSSKHFLFPFSWLCWYLLILYGSSLECSQKGCLDLISICFYWHSDYLAIKNLTSSKNRAVRSMWPVSRCTLIHNWRIACLNANLDVKVSFALCAATEQTGCRVLFAEQPKCDSWRVSPCRMLRGRSVKSLVIGWVQKD